jgi:hypothetical protein
MTMSKQTKKVREANFLRKLVYLRRMGVLPNGVAAVDVAHDPWCGIFEGKRCNCDPDISLKWTQRAAAQN